MALSNLLTIDVEEWFQIHAFSDVIDPIEWDFFESRVERNIYRLLDLLDNIERPSGNFDLYAGNSAEDKPRATFFILGWIAERHPSLVKEIYRRGHEIASHGYFHRAIFYQTRQEFREDISKAKRILEDLCGIEVIGYRAPTFSITENTLWALNILAEQGYQYDSSVFPIHHDNYGMPKAPRFPFIWSLNGTTPKMRKIDGLMSLSLDQTLGSSYSIMEFPMSTMRLLRRNLPLTGGGYFRLYPYLVSKYLMNKMNEQNNPFIFYLHPWEIDPDIPKIKQAKKISQFRTYLNLDKTESRLKTLLSEFSFFPVRSLLSDKIASLSFSYK